MVMVENEEKNWKEQADMGKMPRISPSSALRYCMQDGKLAP